MGQNISKLWIYELVSITYLWMSPKFQTSIQLTFQEIQVCKSTIWTCSGFSIFQELMTGILKDFSFAIAYLDDIIIFSMTAEEHLLHIKQVFEKLQATKLSMK